jgi:hypothetical protein
MKLDLTKWQFKFTTNASYLPLKTEEIPNGVFTGRNE